MTDSFYGRSHTTTSRTTFSPRFRSTMGRSCRNTSARPLARTTTVILPTRGERCIAPSHNASSSKTTVKSSCGRIGEARSSAKLLALQNNSQCRLRLFILRYLFHPRRETLHSGAQEPFGYVSLRPHFLLVYVQHTFSVLLNSRKSVRLRVPLPQLLPSTIDLLEP